MKEAFTLLNKADRACESARVLLDLGDVDGACNRAYYAMFDAARAALMFSGAPEDAYRGKTHSGLITAFSLHLVKDGPIPRDMGRLLKQAEEIRLISDYQGDSVEMEDARTLVDQAAAFLTLIRGLFQHPKD